MENKIASRKNLIIGFIGYLWFLGIILSYFVNHKPLDAPTAASLGQALWRIILCAALFSLSGGAGNLILKRLKWQSDLHPLMLIAVSSGLGLGTLSLLTFITGTLIGIPPWYLWLAIFLLLGILLRKDMLAWWKHFHTFPILWQASLPIEKTIGLILLLLMLCTLSIAVSPPVHFDSLVSHLVMPQAYLQTGRITYLPWLFMSGMPQLGEVLYIPLISLGGNAAPALMGWASALLTALGLLGYLSKRFSVTTAWVGVAALLSGFSLIISTANAYIDWTGMFLGLSALVCLDEWRQHDNRTSLVLSGIFIGFAISTKYTAGVISASLAAALGWHCWQSKRKFLPNLLALALPALAVFFPWMLKNLLATGNPFSPLLFPGGAVTAIRLEGYQGLSPWGNWQDILILPFRATYMGYEKASGYGLSIGPLLLALGALSWIGARQRNKEQRLTLQNAAVTTIAGIIVWAAANQMSGFLLQTRYYYTLFPAFSVLAAVGYDALASIKLPSVRLERLMFALILLVLVLSLIHVSVDTLKSGAPQIILGLQTEENYLTQNLGWYYPVMQYLLEMPEDTHTLLFFEPRGFYCGEHCKPDEIMDRWKRDWVEYKNTEDIKAAWKDEGFTHFLYYQTGANLMRESGAIQYDAEEWQALDSFLATFEEPVNFDDVYLLYTIE